MAAAKKKPELKAVPDDGNQVKKFAARIGTQRQALSDEQMGLASIYKDAEAAGLDRWALKQSTALLKMDPAKAAGRIKALNLYLARLDFLAEEPKLVFTQSDLDLDDVEPAA